MAKARISNQGSYADLQRELLNLGDSPMLVKYANDSSALRTKLITLANNPHLEKEKGENDKNLAKEVRDEVKQIKTNLETIRNNLDTQYNISTLRSSGISDWEIAQSVGHILGQYDISIYEISSLGGIAILDQIINDYGQ